MPRHFQHRIGHTLEHLRMPVWMHSRQFHPNSVAFPPLFACILQSLTFPCLECLGRPLTCPHQWPIRIDTWHRKCRMDPQHLVPHQHLEQEQHQWTFFVALDGVQSKPRLWQHQYLHHWSLLRKHYTSSWHFPEAIPHHYRIDPMLLWWISQNLERLAIPCEWYLGLPWSEHQLVETWHSTFVPPWNPTWNPLLLFVPPTWNPLSSLQWHRHHHSQKREYWELLALVRRRMMYLRKRVSLVVLVLARRCL
mmetsp:Transcript_4794/g.11372  ORF Transcript_4794/g.11372 Transcript_4794/m.11372 type:complete len:250 (-) Transcript_4794:2252-3001(-)